MGAKTSDRLSSLSRPNRQRQKDTNPFQDEDVQLSETLLLYEKNLRDGNDETKAPTPNLIRPSDNSKVLSSFSRPISDPVARPKNVDANKSTSRSKAVKADDQEKDSFKPDRLNSLRSPSRERQKDTNPFHDEDAQLSETFLLYEKNLAGLTFEIKAQKPSSTPAPDGIPRHNVLSSYSRPESAFHASKSAESSVQTLFKERISHLERLSSSSGRTKSSQRKTISNENQDHRSSNKNISKMEDYILDALLEGLLPKSKISEGAKEQGLLPTKDDSSSHQSDLLPKQTTEDPFETEDRKLNELVQLYQRKKVEILDEKTPLKPISHTTKVTLSHTKIGPNHANSGFENQHDRLGSLRGPTRTRFEENEYQADQDLQLNELVALYRNRGYDNDEDEGLAKPALQDSFGNSRQRTNEPYSSNINRPSYGGRRKETSGNFEETDQFKKENLNSSKEQNINRLLDDLIPTSQFSHEESSIGAINEDRTKIEKDSEDSKGALNEVLFKTEQDSEDIKGAVHEDLTRSKQDSEDSKGAGHEDLTRSEQDSEVIFHKDEPFEDIDSFLDSYLGGFLRQDEARISAGSNSQVQEDERSASQVLEDERSALMSAKSSILTEMLKADVSATSLMFVQVWSTGLFSVLFLRP